MSVDSIRIVTLQVVYGSEETYPFAQMSLVVLVKSQPLVHEFTSPAVFPFALPKVWPLTSGKNNGHCLCQYSALTVRETRVETLDGAALEKRNSQNLAQIKEN